MRTLDVKNPHFSANDFLHFLSLDKFDVQSLPLCSDFILGHSSSLLCQGFLSKFSPVIDWTYGRR